MSIQPASVQGTPTLGSKSKRGVYASWLTQLPELYSLKDRVIFTVGTHKGKAYTKQNLAEMVEAFEPTLNQLKPRVRLGHDDAQSYARLAFGKMGTKADEQSLGMPALGYVDNLRLNAEYTDRNGRKHEAGTEILADFVNLDAGLHADLMALRYPERSAEVIRNYADKEQPGTVWPTVLQNVAFLGDELPAVRGMAPLVERNTADLPEVELVIFRFSEGDEMPVETPPGVPGKPVVMSPEEMTAAIQKLMAAVDALMSGMKDRPEDEMAKDSESAAALAAKTTTCADPAKPETGPVVKPVETNAAVPAAPAMPMAQTPPPAPAGKEEKGMTVNIHSERLAALEAEVKAGQARFVELQANFVRQQSETLMKQAKQEADTFAESLCQPGNMRITAEMKAEVARVYQNAPDVEKFSDSGKSYKEELAALLNKLPLLARPEAFQNRALTLVPRDPADGAQAEAVRFAEDGAKKLAKEQGIPYAQALYRFSMSEEMSPQQLMSALYTGNNGTAGV